MNSQIEKYTIYKLRDGKYIKGYVASRCYYKKTIMKNGEIKHKVELPYTDLSSFMEQFPYPNMTQDITVREVDELYDTYEEAKEQVRQRNEDTIKHILRNKPKDEKLLLYAIDCIDMCKEFEEYIEKETKNMKIGYQKRLSKN